MSNPMNLMIALYFISSQTYLHFVECLFLGNCF